MSYFTKESFSFKEYTTWGHQSAIQSAIYHNKSLTDRHASTFPA